MKKKDSSLSKIPIEPLIGTIREQRVILDSDLAKIYGVSTKRLNEQVKRNADRFPADFAFRLSLEEFEILRSQFATSSSSGKTMRSQIATASKRNIRYLPYAFTEHGAIMAATVLNSPRAVQMSVFVVRAFVKMREQLIAYQRTERRLAEIERALLINNEALRELYRKIRPLLQPEPEPPRRKIGFHVKEKRAKYGNRRKRSGKEK